MRVLQLTHGLYPERVGGVEVHTLELARALRRGHEVTVVAPSKAPSREFTLDGIRVHQVCVSDEDRRGLPAIVATVADLLNGFAPDVVHLQHLGLSDAKALAVFERLRGARVPFVLSLHDYWYVCPRSTLVDWLGRRCAGPAPARCGRCVAAWGTKNPWRWFTRRGDQIVRREEFARLLAACHLVVPVSEYVAERYSTLGVSRNRMVVVTPGIRRPQAVTTAATAPAARLAIAFIGQVRRHKGVAVLVQALALMKTAGSLDVWGDGDQTYLQELERLVGSLGVAAVFHGPYEQESLDRILAAMDVVVVPSEWDEPFGLVVQEALARCRVVVASRVGGIEEQILDGVNGYLVPPGDPVRLAEALDRVATRFGAGARPSRPIARPSLGFRSIDQEAADWNRIYALVIAHWNAPEVAAVEFELGAVVTAIATSLAAPREEVLSAAVRLRTTVPTADGAGSGGPVEVLLGEAITERSFLRGVLRRQAAAALYAHGCLRVAVVGGGLGLDAMRLSIAGFDVTVIEPDPQRADAVLSFLADGDHGVRLVTSAREASPPEAVFVPGPGHRTSDGCRLAAQMLRVGGLFVTGKVGEAPTGFVPELTAGALGIGLWRRR